MGNTLIECEDTGCKHLPGRKNQQKTAKGSTPAAAIGNPFIAKGATKRTFNGPEIKIFIFSAVRGK